MAAQLRTNESPRIAKPPTTSINNTPRTNTVAMHEEYTPPFQNLNRATASGQRFEACIMDDTVILIGNCHPDEWVTKKHNAWMQHIETEEHKAAVERIKARG